MIVIHTNTDESITTPCSLARSKRLLLRVSITGCIYAYAYWWVHESYGTRDPIEFGPCKRAGHHKIQFITDQKPESLNFLVNYNLQIAPLSTKSYVFNRNERYHSLRNWYPSWLHIRRYVFPGFIIAERKKLLVSQPTGIIYTMGNFVSRAIYWVTLQFPQTESSW